MKSPIISLLPFFVVMLLAMGCHNEQITNAVDDTLSTASLEKPVKNNQGFVARLSGGEVVPAVATDASGQASFQLSQNGMELSYNVKVRNIEDVIGAHIHLGALGANGDLVVRLFYDGWPPLGPNHGNLASGVITAAMLEGALEGYPLSALIAEIDVENTYLDITTVGYPEAEIRGQIRSR